MKMLISKLVKFFIYFVTLTLILYIFIAALFMRKLDSMSLDKNVNTLVLGDSHTQCAINDSLYKNTVNFSISSEHYLLTYNVLKLIIKNNPDLKNLILGCSFHSFSAFNDRYLFGEKNKKDIFSEIYYSRYFPILDDESKFLLLKTNPDGVIKSFRMIIFNMLESFTENYTTYHDYPFIGRFYPGKNRVLKDSLINASIAWHFYADSSRKVLEDFSGLQITYLKKIIQLCMDNHIKLILLNTPVHEKYDKQVPEKFITEYYSMMRKFEKNDNVLFFDYHDYKFTDDYFGDGNHLNLPGASIFTNIVMQRLNND